MSGVDTVKSSQNNVIKVFCTLNSEANQDEVGAPGKIIDEALLKYYFVNISLLPRYIFIQHTKSSQTHNIT